MLAAEAVCTGERSGLVLALILCTAFSWGALVLFVQNLLAAKAFAKRDSDVGRAGVRAYGAWAARIQPYVKRLLIVGVASGGALAYLLWVSCRG